MNTNDSQFLKAYNDLVSAFFNFMNVVNPQNSEQHNLSYVASQLNQLLNYLSDAPHVATSINAPEVIGDGAGSTVNSQTSTSTKNPPAQISTPTETNPQPKFDSANAKSKYCAYPELVNGHYKFKSGMISEVVGENSVYKLTIDEDSQMGFVEILDISGDLLKTVANNPSLYTPSGLCPEANNITADKTLVKSKTKLPIVKVVRGWEIAEGEKFELTIN